MPKIDWKLWSKSYPYICDECEYKLWEYKEICEGCGAMLSVRKTTKDDYKKWKKK